MSIQPFFAMRLKPARKAVLPLVWRLGLAPASLWPVEASVNGSRNQPGRRRREPGRHRLLQAATVSRAFESAFAYFRRVDKSRSPASAKREAKSPLIFLPIAGVAST
jgi:hypothetical protein